MGSYTLQHNSMLRKDHFLIPLAVFLLVNLGLFLFTGVHTGLEADKYVTEGNYLYDHGTFTAPKYIFYLPVILLVWTCRFLSLPVAWAALVQVALSGVALYCFYRLAECIRDKRTAVLSATLLALFIPLQLWNLFLYTDSIFISLTIIYTWLIYSQGKKGLRGTLIILGFLFLLIFSRPHGLLIIPPTLVYLIFRKQTKQQRAISALLCVALLGGMYFFLNAAFSGGGDMDAMKPFIEEHIICFVPMKPEGAVLDIIHTSSPVNDLLYYVIHNPLHFARLTALKLFSFFNLTRSYYSMPHNIVLAALIIPVYFFFVAGIRRFLSTGRDLVIYVVSLLILYPFGATFQCDDWHSRFTMVVFPYIILIATMGILNFFGKSKTLTV